LIKKTLKNRKLFIAGILITGALFTGFIAVNDRLFSIAKNLEIFSEMFRVLNEQYVDELNPNQVVKTGMDKMLDELDPYTNFFSEDMVEDIRTMRTGQYAGIGITTRRFNTRTRITEISEGSPAARTSLRPGDEILGIDGIALKTLNPEEAEKLMKGQAGNSVRLQIRKYGSATTEEIVIKREKLQLKTVSFVGMVNPKTGYLSLDEFGAESASEVKAALLSLKEKGALSLILDLRGNPGGLLDQAVNICSLFIPKGSLVVTNRGKTEESILEYHTRSAPMEPEIPVVVLIDRNSASASEIVAGTLQDYDRAVVIGERSYGKGLVQTRRPLSFNSFSMITTAKYYTPSGRCIQALDYKNRKQDGSAGVTADSLKKIFYTKNGRKVFDGGGIDPDISVSRVYYPEVISFLEDDGYFLDYVSGYLMKNTPAPNPEMFELSSNAVEDYITGAGKKKILLNSELENALHFLEEPSKEKQAINGLDQSASELQTGIQKFRIRQLKDQKDELRKILTRAIATGYYFKKGGIQASFKYDSELKTALEIMGNTEKMNRILAKQTGQ